MKRCTKCGIEKHESEFSKNSRSCDGLRSQCKACDSLNSAAYREADPEKAIERRASRYAANAEAAKAYSRAYNAANAEAISAKNAVYRAANAELLKARQAAKCLSRTLRRFGIPKEAYEALLVAQDNACPVCGHAYTPGACAGHARSPVVEHSHAREARLGARNSLRGIVCGRCNRTHIRRADEYLKKHGILDTDPEALPELLKRKVSFAENVAYHVVSTWAPTEAEKREK